MSSRTRSRKQASIGSNHSLRRPTPISVSEPRTGNFVLLLVMAWSPPAHNAGNVRVSALGDYATFNSNHTPDGTPAFFVLDRTIDGATSQISARIKNRNPSRRLLLMVGALMGLAMLSRETTVLAIASFGVLFLAGYGMSRRFYLLIGVGFFAIVGLEFTYLWGMTGN